MMSTTSKFWIAETDMMVKANVGASEVPLSTSSNLVLPERLSHRRRDRRNRIGPGTSLRHGLNPIHETTTR